MERHNDHARRGAEAAPRPRGRRAGRRAHDRLTRVARSPARVRAATTPRTPASRLRPPQQGRVVAADADRSSRDKRGAARDAPRARSRAGSRAPIANATAVAPDRRSRDAHDRRRRRRRRERSSRARTTTDARALLLVLLLAHEPRRCSLFPARPRCRRCDDSSSRSASLDDHRIPYPVRVRLDDADGGLGFGLPGTLGGEAARRVVAERPLARRTRIGPDDVARAHRRGLATTRR